MYTYRYTMKEEKTSRTIILPTESFVNSDGTYDLSLLNVGCCKWNILDFILLSVWHLMLQRKNQSAHFIFETNGRMKALTSTASPLYMFEVCIGIADASNLSDPLFFGQLESITRSFIFVVYEYWIRFYSTISFHHVRRDIIVWYLVN